MGEISPNKQVPSDHLRDPGGVWVYSLAWINRGLRRRQYSRSGTCIAAKVVALLMAAPGHLRQPGRPAARGMSALPPKADKLANGSVRQLCADFVAEVRDYSSEAAASILGTVLTIRSLQSAEAGALTHDIGYARHGSAAGGGRATSFASRRRVCAIAARVNSSCAPHGPRNRSRPSRKMRLR